MAAFVVFTFECVFLFLPECVEQHDAGDEEGDADNDGDCRGHYQQVANWTYSIGVAGRKMVFFFSVGSIPFQQFVWYTMWISHVDKVEADDVVACVL